MTQRGRIEALLWAAFGLYVTYQGLLLKLGTGRAPKPGFMVFWVGVTIVILSGLFFIENVRTPERDRAPLWRGVGWLRGVRLLAALFLYASTFQFLGFIVSTFLLLVYMFKGLEPQSWRSALLLSAATVAICYLVFGVFLKLQFPPGVLSFLPS